MRQDMSRRGMLGAVGVLGASALAARGADDKPAEEAGDVRLGDPVVTRTQSLDPGAVGENVSPDGHAMTLFFGDPTKGDLQIGLSGTGQPLSAIKLATIQVPVRAGDGATRLVGYAQFIQGFIQKTKGSRVVILADCGGTTKVVEYPFGQEVTAQDYLHAFFSPNPRFTGDPQEAAVPQFTITLSVLAQTRSSEDAVLVSIDSLDVEAQLAGAPAMKRSRPADPFKSLRHRPRI